ncbi:hypothetical protein CRENBAI_017403 [Crenichthys baileyi]|uniref:Uncharacterized protein n=1 Tax=Crenichthys baileyi TaxID=28760 RepID=A0AAV9RR90_9TELE
MEARATMHRTTTPTPKHAKQRRTECSNEHPKQKPCTKPTPGKCAPTSPLKKKSPAKVHPLAPRKNPHQSPQKAESPQSQNQNPARSRGQSTPRSAPTSPPATPMQTRIRNWNLDKEPESKSEPPRSKRCPSLPKANHPPPPRKKTYTHPNIRTTPRTHKTLDSQVDSAPPPPTDPAPRQQSAILEGESTCTEMVPTCQFRRPLRPPMRRTPPGWCRVPEHAPAQNPGDIPARTQAPPGPARTPAQGWHSPKTQSPQAHARSAQEQPGHQASNLCPPVQAPQKHRMQPPDFCPFLIHPATAELFEYFSI